MYADDKQTSLALATNFMSLDADRMCGVEFL